MKTHLTLIILSLTLLILLAEATPTPAIHPGPGWIPLDKRDDQRKECGPANITDRTSLASPLVADCRQLAFNIRDGGSWSVLGSAQKQILQCKSCAFGVTGSSVTGRVDTYYVGNRDVIEMIDRSIGEFKGHVNEKGEGIIGAEGNMPCKAMFSTDTIVNWGIYNTGFVPPPAP
ncbi:putative necrosis-inducing factor-domain-containing protein [Podospora didyma]|uniref:Necrosis-inducing factor-domain-containing protein n=1 Tax=Podospora didyma TaxID=330526 RepID=A0AAE0NQR2_9PEZI|nr:putative necrosis-inducing factor-domain-containing protein [Podospora didyma]